MSHNTINVADQAADRAGAVTLPTNKLGGFTSATAGKYLGLDGSGDPKLVAPTNELSIIASSHGFPSSYSGSFPSLSVGSRMEWRRSSSVEYVNSTYAEFTYAGYPGYVVWGNQVTLQAGNYLAHATWPADTSSASNELHLRLRNETDGSDVGPYHMLGGGRSANAMNSYISISGAKVFSWQVTAVSGTWQTGLAVAHHGFSILIIRL